MRSRRALALLALVSLCVSCSKASDPGNPAGPGGGAAPTGTGLHAGIDTPITLAATGTPKRGGKLTYGLEADTDGFDPAVSRMVTSGLIMAHAVYDPLAAYAADGSAKPYLAEKIEPNADFTKWTITLRSGIRFSNDEPLDADAVINHFGKMRKSPLTNAALDLMDEAEPATKIDELTLRVNMLGPWALFPVLLTGQLGVIPAPAFYAEPDPKVRADNPIGTGPFIVRSREHNVVTEMVRNPNYWRKDAAGTQLPYLEAVAFKFYTQNNQRDDALERGDINMEFNTFGTSAGRLTKAAKEGKSQVYRDPGSEEQVFIQLNMDKPPLDDIRIRRAFNYAIDRKDYVKTSDDAEAWISNNVFSPRSPWYVDAGTPGYDLDKAKALVEEYTKEKGAKPSFTFKTNEAVENQKVGQYIAAKLNEAGMDVRAAVSTMDAFPTELVFGQYDTAYVRLFGSPDPEGDRYWFESKNASKPGEGRLGLNLARLRDAEVDEALAEARATTDLSIRKAAYKRFQERITELVPYIWLTVGVKYIAADNRVRGITNGPLPDGTESLPAMVGVTRLTHTWMT